MEFAGLFNGLLSKPPKMAGFSIDSIYDKFYKIIGMT